MRWGSFPASVFKKNMQNKFVLIVCSPMSKVERALNPHTLNFSPNFNCGTKSLLLSMMSFTPPPLKHGSLESTLWKNFFGEHYQRTKNQHDLHRQSKIDSLFKYSLRKSLLFGDFGVATFGRDNENSLLRTYCRNHRLLGGDNSCVRFHNFHEMFDCSSLICIQKTKCDLPEIMS